MWKHFNPNPCERSVGDCAVRAVAKALDISWQESYAMICANGFALCDMPSSNSVWGSVLREHGFRRESIEPDCEDCFTAGDFCLTHPKGTYVLGFGTHVATVVDGDLYDSWDSSKEIPQYYWAKE